MKNAIIAAVVAAVVASGTTYAATRVNGRMIVNHTISAKKLTRHAMRLLRGRRGPAGLKGIPGPAGAIDLSKMSLIDSGNKTVAPGTSITVKADCPTGDKVTGGGFSIVNGSNDLIDADSSGPNTTLSTWATTVHNKSATNATVHAYAVCVSR
jgi:hypothetical protein